MVVFTGTRFFAGNRTHWIAHEGDVRALAFASDSQSLISLGQDARIRRWHCRTWKEQPLGVARDWKVKAFCVSADGKRLAVSDVDGSVIVIDLTSEEVLVRFDNDRKKRVTRLEFSRDSITLVGYCEISSSFLVWSLRENTRIAEITLPFSDCRGFAIHPDGRSLFTSQHLFSGIFEYDLATGKRIRAFGEGDERFGKLISSFTVAPDGKTLVTTAWNGGFVTEWSLETFERKRSFRATRFGPSFNVALSNDGKWIATMQSEGNYAVPSCVRIVSEEDHSVKLTCSTPRQFAKRQTQLNYHCIALSKNGTLLAGGHKGGVISIRPLDAIR